MPKAGKYKWLSSLCVPKFLFTVQAFTLSPIYIYDPNTLHALSSLIQMCDDLLENMDNCKINCVVFLDVRKAFDCINHEILLKKMLNYFAISGIPLN